MRYLVRARVKPGRGEALVDAIDSRRLGQGSIAGDEYLRNLNDARQLDDGTLRWVEVCYRPSPLLEERPYWEEYFDLIKVQDAHARAKCARKSKLATLARSGEPFLKRLRRLVGVPG